MELIRFELFRHGNVHCGGLVSSHDDTGLMNRDYETCIHAIQVFNRYLPVPPYYELGEYNRAFFTEAGYARFQKTIERLVKAIHGYCDGWEVREIRAIVPQEYVMYRDEYQAIIDLNFYEQLLQEEAF